ncbi:hypothetical protein CN140_20250 [Sinorhizobium meliloti]|uniref:DUF3846 domain-containing protein n=1 Tax=Rhizobium meliloti TaxID=382 RepID=UPI000FDC6361|nr:hypothetical protein [Sinorhizobium meliloti]RVL80278.1 hypothetical protein CN140_20250 [Sinorhizobium meliloti]
MVRANTAYVLDPETTIFKPVALQVDLGIRPLYEIIGCRLLEVERFDERHTLFVDEEGLQDGLTAFTIFEGFPQPIAGKIVLSPSTNEGSNGDRINSIDRDPLKSMLKFDHLQTRISVYNRDLCCSLHILEKANCQCS